jgi:hypothetical protein
MPFPIPTHLLEETDACLTSNRRLLETLDADLARIDAGLARNARLSRLAQRRRILDLALENLGKSPDEHNTQ